MASQLLGVARCKPKQISNVKTSNPKIKIKKQGALENDKIRPHFLALNKTNSSEMEEIFLDF
jgi:hypothetical protein